MFCAKCGTELKDGNLYCHVCGQPIQIVPDFNPLEDVLTENILNFTKSGRPDSKSGSLYGITRAEAKSISAADTIKDETSITRFYGKYHRMIKIAVLVFVIILICLVCYTKGYQHNSYSYQMAQADKLMEKVKYERAEVNLERALEIKNDSIEARCYLSDIYVERGTHNIAISLLKEAVVLDPSSIEAYGRLLKIYEEQEMDADIIDLLGTCKNEKVLEKYKDYQTVKPTFSLSGQVYQDLQDLELSCENGDIYYTVDGSKATEESLKYRKPIHLIEGRNVIRAIAVNKKGVEGSEVSKTYVINLAAPNAPVVSPASGTYGEPVQIIVKVPDGCRAYYTMDGTVPSVDSLPYLQPIILPEGYTVFSAILVDKNEMISKISRREYEFINSNEE